MLGSSGSQGRASKSSSFSCSPTNLGGCEWLSIALIWLISASSCGSGVWARPSKQVTNSSSAPTVLVGMFPLLQGAHLTADSFQLGANTSDGSRNELLQGSPARAVFACWGERVTIPRSYCKLLICEFSPRWLLFYTGSHDYRSGYFRPRAGEVLRRGARREGHRLRDRLRRGLRLARPQWRR